MTCKNTKWYMQKLLRRYIYISATMYHDLSGFSITWKKLKVIWFSLSFVWKPWWNTCTHFWNSTSIIFFPPLESKTISHRVLALAFVNLAILQPLLSTNYLKYFHYCNYIMPHLSKVIPCYSLPNIFLKITICL